MTHYRRRPLIVEAIRFYDGNSVEVAEWLTHQNVNWRVRTDHYDGRKDVFYLDLVADLTAVVTDGQWIILTVPDGKFYSVMDDVKFDEKFEPAAE